MREHFAHQLANNKIVTQEALDKVSIKTYLSGKDIKPDDTVLFAFMKINKDVAELIALHEDEIDKYEFSHYPTDHIPEIKLK
jgi:hypothetical protein